MGAYYQNQVVTEDPATKQTYTLVQEDSGFKFMESQYATDIGTINVIRELSEKTSKDNTGRVYCVCDYDELQEDENTRPFLFPKKDSFGVVDTSAVKVSVDSNGDEVCTPIPNSRYLRPKITRYDEKSEPLYLDYGVFNGFAVCADTKEYLDINKITEISEKLYTEHQSKLVSPLSLLTRKNKRSMGGGDIPEPLYEDFFDLYITQWYHKNIYWTSNRPNDDFTDITREAMWFEKKFEEKNIRNEHSIYITNHYYLVPVFNTEHSPYES